MVRVFSFVFPFPSLTFFPLNNNILSTHVGRVVLCFPFWFLDCIHVRAYSFRVLFVCISVLRLVAFRFVYRIVCRDGVMGLI